MSNESREYVASLDRLFNQANVNTQVKAQYAKLKNDQIAKKRDNTSRYIAKLEALTKFAQSIFKFTSEQSKKLDKLGDLLSISNRRIKG